MINRYSSRKQKLDESFLNSKLKEAKSYDRIAGYFRSSILELTGEALENIEGKVRVVCNSDLNIEDVKTATAAHNAMRKDWCSNNPEEEYKNMPSKLKKLYNLLKSGKMEVRVIPNEAFGLIHGKAGVITFKDDTKTSFIGSINESYSAFKINYELIWEDDSQEAIDWVQEEFNSLWNSRYAVPLSDFIIEDINRISKREKIDSIEAWKKEANPAEIVVESSVYRKELGLWDHQKYFVNLAFNEHKKSYGARYILADMVGLGKTIQLALSAQLMALYGDKPILVIAPKTLIWQWQEEINNLLDMPSAVWDGKDWIDENGIKHISDGINSIKKCPRRVGIVSQGLITANSPITEKLLEVEYECIIVDECHRARRKNLGQNKEHEKANPNNLMKFLLQISKKTKSMLLATATPVQLHPIEAYDLMNILSQKNDSVLGSIFSKWRTEPNKGLDLVMGKENSIKDTKIFEWVRDPFPPSSENKDFELIRRNLELKDDDFIIMHKSKDKLRKSELRRLERIIEGDYIQNYNPYLRHIVRRTRDYLENTINPETGEVYLKPVRVKLFGEGDREAIILPVYLKEAYKYAEQFCTLLQKRVKGGGFFKTLLLKRLGSTMIAGKNTAEKLLQDVNYILDDDEDELVDFNNEDLSEFKNLSTEEITCLNNLIYMLEENEGNDPKYNLIHKLLLEYKWLERGCIIFSQYYDSAYWVAESLSKDLKNIKIGIYAGGDKSGIIINGRYERCSKENIKEMVKNKQIKILVGTDAASEGLNLQTLGSLINLDLPWNPTRLEQRKGRIQRIGQVYDEVYIYNMRYKDSVEDKVHFMLSERLESIHSLFGQIPDILQDVWIDVALNEIEKAKERIDAVPKKHPFNLRYQSCVSSVDWESCSRVLDITEKRKHLTNGWR